MDFTSIAHGLAVPVFVETSVATDRSRLQDLELVQLLEQHVERHAAIAIDAPLAAAIDAFRLTPDIRMLPVVDAQNRPVGAIYERDVRGILFNPFGHALLANPAFGKRLAHFVRGCPTAEMTTAVDALIDGYVAAAGTEGLILVKHGCYAGFLPNRALLRIAAERERAIHRQKLDDLQARSERAQKLEGLFARFEREAGQLANLLVSAATQLEGVASNMAQHAARNSEQMALVASATAQTANGVGEVSANCTALANAVKLVSGELMEAKAAVKDAVALVAESSSKARSLASAADEIGGVVGLIESIAVQVNLLALNATIEAGRAGGAGRGFVAVAGEIKSLSRQTREATARIAERIATVRSVMVEAAAANTATEQVVLHVDAISTRIAGTVEKQLLTTATIAAIVEQAAAASADISRALADIGERANATGRQTTEMQSVAQALSGQATNLQEGVAAFLAEVRAS